jgi:hypothetical protein
MCIKLREMSLRYCITKGGMCLITLTVLAEVKVDLANFDVKFQTKLLCIRYKKIPIPAETSFKSF